MQRDVAANLKKPMFMTLLFRKMAYFFSSELFLSNKESFFYENHNSGKP